MNAEYPGTSKTFNDLVDKLKDKSEEELKLLYMKIFSEDLKKEWSNLSNESDLEKASEQEIVQAIQAKRYKK